MMSQNERNEIAAFVLEEVHRCWLRADFEHALKTAIQNIRESPPPAPTAGKVELYRNNRFHDDAGWLDNYVRDTAAEAVIEAAIGLCGGIDWNHGTHAITHGYRQKPIDAVKTLMERRQ
jgi:hypothetical protein